MKENMNAKKFKVVFVDYKLVCGGAEKALLDLIALLDKDKFEVSVFAQHSGGGWDEKFWNAGIGVDYDYTCRRATWNPIGKVGNLLKKQKIQKSIQNQSAGLLDICCPGADIVVNYSAWDADEIAFAKNAKTVKYIHGDPATNPAYYKEATEDRELLKRYDRIICVSDAAWKSFREISGIHDKVELHYNPLNSEEVLEKSQIPVEVPQDLPVVCAVGRLSPEKGFERLILTHKKLLDQGIRHRLLIVGDGTDREFLHRLIQATGTQNTVMMAGYQENPYPYMKASKFLVNSSFTEGLPVIAMEALSLGVPMVATVPSVGEAFGKETCGIIAENSMEGLEASICKMLTDDDFYAKAKAGAERRSAFFDGRRMVKEIEELFLELMETN